MEPEVLDIATTAKGLAVLSAIPIVLYALWAEYFGQYVDHLQTEEPEFDRASESEKGRITALFVILFEFTLFLGSPEVRQAFPIYSQLGFIAGIIAVLKIQSSLEKRIYPKGTGRDDLMGILARGLLSWILGTALYLGVLVACVQTFAYVADRLHLPSSANLSVMIAGGFVGVILGLGINYALSPWILRKILPIGALEDAAIRSQIEYCFKKAKLQPTPAFWVVELEKFRLATLLIAGLQKGRGIFRQSLFVSRWALLNLNADELKAVVMNQISHVVLRHLKKRFLFSSLMIVIIAAIAISAVWMTRSVASLQIALEVIGPAVALFSFVISFRLLGIQAKRHEIEADLHCLINLGVPFDHWASALRKMDSFPSANAGEPPVVHPETERRIEMIRFYLDKVVPISDQKAG